MRNDFGARNDQIAALNLRQGYEAPLRQRIAELEAELKRVLDKYDEENPARTADYHLTGCDCMRCCVDDARATLTKSTS